MKTREENRNDKQTEIERFDWFIERIQMRVAFGWLSERSAEKKLLPQELSRNQPILRFDIILQHDWPIEQCLLHIRVFFGGKTKRPCFDLFTHWLIKQITNTHGNHFSRSYESDCNGVSIPLTSTHKPCDYTTSWRVLGELINGRAYIRPGVGDSYNGLTRYIAMLTREN